jgi:hypothetical protein
LEEKFVAKLSIRKMLALPLIGVAALANGSAFAQTAQPSILTDKTKPLPDYSYAGYGFGLASIPTDTGAIIDATAHGVVADDGKDDAKALLKALSAADAMQGKVTVRLPKGRVQIGEIIPLTRSDLVLDGAGDEAGGTELYFPRPLKVVDTSDRQAELRDYLKREDKYQREPDQNINFLFTEYSWSGGFLFVGPKGTRPVSYDGNQDKRDPVLTDAVAGKQFSRILTVKNPKALKVGQVVQLQWFSGDGPKSAILKSLYGDIEPWNAKQTDKAMKLAIGSHHWTFPNRPVVGQSTRIAAIKGNKVTLGDPLLHDVRPDQPAVFADWQHLTNVGIQNIKMTFPMSPWFGHHLEQGYNGIYFTGVFDGWAKNLTIENADSGIMTDNAASLTLADIATTGEHKAHYSVHIGAAHNVLVTGLRVENPAVHPISVNTRSSRSVYHKSIVLREAVIDQHSGSNHQNLFDDITVKVSADRVGAPAQQGMPFTYRLWEAGGAPYWKPGHGLYNTQWNIRMDFAPDVPKSAQVMLTSGLEGPGAYLVGFHGNRPLTIDYAPTPYVEGLNAAPTVPSLYDYQLAQRRKKP